MAVFYIDQNIVIDHATDERIVNAVTALRSGGALFPFSPAHLEEVSKAHALRRGAPIADQIRNLTDISRGLAIMPVEGGPAEFRREDVLAGLTRVWDGDGRALTEWAVSWERARIAGYVAPGAEKAAEATREKVRKCHWTKVFSEPHVLEHVDHLAREHGFRLRTSTFQDRERTLSTLFDVLNAFGFKAEHAAKHIENRVHDVSHAIYASYADVFVTNDDKLRDTTKAVYQRCGFEVEILDREQFLAHAGA